MCFAPRELFSVPVWREFFSPHIVYRLRDLAAYSFGNITCMASRGLTCVSGFLGLHFRDGTNTFSLLLFKLIYIFFCVRRGVTLSE